MSEKKVVVQVLADTKPFIKSLGKLRAIAESVNSAQIKSSNKVLKNVASTARINQKIHQIALKNAKIQERVSRDAERAQGRFLQGAVRTVAVLDMVRRSFNVIKGGFLSGYKTGRDIVDAARTYGVPLQQATRANALYSAFGGEAGGGAKIMSDFLQNQMEFMLYQRGTLKEASALFGLNPATLMHGELVDFVKELRRIKEERGLNKFQTQGLLQAVGLGGDAAIMRMVSGTREEFLSGIASMSRTDQPSEKTLSGIEKTEKEFETMKTNIKTKFAEWASYLGPVIEKFNKLGATTQAVATAMASLGGALGAGALLKGGAGTAMKLGGRSLLTHFPYVGAAIAGGYLGYKASDALKEHADAMERDVKDPSKPWHERIGKAIETALNPVHFLTRASEGIGEALSPHDWKDVDVVESANKLRRERGGSGSVRNITYNVFVNSTPGSDPYTYGERAGYSFNEAVNNNQFFLNGSTP